MPTPVTPTTTAPVSLWWPGDHRAGELMGDAAFLAAMVRAEEAWLTVLVDAGVAPAEARPTDGLADLAVPADLPALAEAAEAGGNPVIPLVALLRDRLGDSGEEAAATWLHRGLTSQDVVDTAMVLCARDALDRVAHEVGAQVTALRDLVATHRATPMVARTLTQTAVPTTFGAKVATWLHGVLDAADDLAALVLPVQLGGAAGTLSGLVELAGPDGSGGLDAARACRAAYGPALGLAPSAPWHTRRTPVTRIGDVAVTACDAWGRIAHDVLALGRPEVGELAEGSGGGSSTMPHKANPTLSVLVRRAALTAPQLAATLHVAAADQVDERAAGGWHAEWATLAVLLRRTVVAATHTTTLLADLRVDTVRMADRLDGAHDEVRAEQRALADLAGHAPAPAYDGLLDDLVDEALARADAHLERSAPTRPTEETP